MKLHKVKYTRNEYRSEYLKSNEWLNLRSLVLAGKPDCQCCNKKLASDVHHLVYRNIVDVKVTDLLPLCRECHDFVHSAIKYEFISTDPQQVDQIRNDTLNILENESFKNFLKWLKKKHFLSPEELLFISFDRSAGFCIQRISGVMKKHVKYEDLAEMKFTGTQLLKIRKIIQTSIWRKAQKYKKGGPLYKKSHLPKGWEQRMKKR
jgi:hypothetical protein